MSFQVSFKVHDDGAIELAGASGDVPAGTYFVGGHKHNGDETNFAYNSISVTSPYASASGGAQVHTKETAQ